MAFAENHGEFLDTGEFAVTASWESTQVLCIFDAAYVDPFNIESTNPVAWCDTGDITGVAHGQTFLVEGSTYKIRGVQPDGTGMTLLKLAWEADAAPAIAGQWDFSTADNSGQYLTVGF